jgi:hypothetical protein
MRRTVTIAGVIIVLIILAVGVYLFFFRGTSNQAEPSASQDAQTSATQGLETLKQMVNANNYQGMGFNSVQDAAAVTLGEPLPIYRIGLDQLKVFKRGDDPQKLLADDKRILYPVLVNGQATSSISVEAKNDGWRATDFGNANLMKAIARVQPAKGDFFVQIPALKVYFVGHIADNTLILTPTLDDPRFQFAAGKPLPADVALLAIQPTAQTYNGLPQ